MAKAAFLSADSGKTQPAHHPKRKQINLLENKALKQKAI
jgi:hypothetical protein